MDRSGFLKSLFVLAIAPKVIAEIGIEKKVGFALYTQPVIIKKAFYEKCCIELLDDFEGFECYMKYSIQNFERMGLDITKPHEIKKRL